VNRAVSPVGAHTPVGARTSGTQPAVLFVSVPTGIGGSTRSLANVLAALRGDTDRILAGPAQGRFVELVDRERLAERRLPIVSHRPRLRPLRRALASARLAVFVLGHRRMLTAIHANGLKELSLSLPAAFLGRVPLVVWVHNFLLPPSVRLFGPLWRRLLPRCDVRWAAVSPLARDLVVDAGLAHAGDVMIVPNPIDPADVLAGPPRLAHDPVAVAYLGAPREYKGFQFLPDIVQAVEAAAPEAALQWLVFSNPTDDDLATTWDRLLALERSAELSLSIEGKLTDVRAAYERCDIVVCPSVLDSFCRVAAEAMLNGLPVVGSDLPPIRDLLGDDEAGLLVPPGDVDAAAKAIVRLVDDPELRARLGATGAERAAAFTPESVRALLLERYGIAGPHPSNLRC
jgi:glycosyltransferase involved in cell wall biosynthesis